MKKILIILFVISFTILRPACAEEQAKSFQGLEFLTGFSQGHLKEKKDYRLVPLIVDFNFNLKPLTKKIGFNPPSLVQFQIEPYISAVTSPEANIEAGTSFLFKCGLLPEDWTFQPYLRAGVGVSYMSLHTLDQSTQCNFLSHFGLGVHYFFQKNLGLTAEYRFRHLSNASIKHPNSGIDTHSILLGVYRRF